MEWAMTTTKREMTTSEVMKKTTATMMTVMSVVQVMMMNVTTVTQMMRMKKAREVAAKKKWTHVVLKTTRVGRREEGVRGGAGLWKEGQQTRASRPPVASGGT